MTRSTIIGIFVLRTIFTVLHLDFSCGQVLYKSDNCCYECYQKNTAETSRKIAFSVNFHKSSQRLNNSNQIVVFKNVLVNHGSGYNTNTGIFTTPHAGTYAFFVSVQVPPNERLSTYLTLNGKLASVSLVGRIQDYNTGSNMAILRLKKGDQVWVKTHPNVLHWGYSSDGVTLNYAGNSFSGFLLF